MQYDSPIENVNSDNSLSSPVNQPKTESDSSIISPLPPKITNKLLIFLVILIITALIGGIYLYIQNQPQKSQTKESSLTQEKPSPTPDPTLEWKIYTNTKYNFSLKYPDIFFTTNAPEDTTVIFYLSNEEGISKYELYQKPQITVQIHEKTTLVDIANTLEEAKKTQEEILEKSNITPTEDGLIELDLKEKTQNGQKAYYFEKFEENYMGITTYLEKNGSTYSVGLLSINEYNDYYKVVYDQILSTFMFID
jgi:hypothetical protein